MGILSWILLGLIVGVLAKWLMPGDDPGGVFVTIAIGVAGAFVGGFIASLLGHRDGWRLQPRRDRGRDRRRAAAPLRLPQAQDLTAAARE